MDFDNDPSTKRYEHEVYRCNLIRLGSWTIAIVLGALLWYGIYLVATKVYSHYKPVQYRATIHVLDK